MATEEFVITVRTANLTVDLSNHFALCRPHGGWDYQPWLLKVLKANHDSTGRRFLDVFSLHYSQYSEFGQGDSSAATQLKRNESTRDLWDPNYVSSSWIHSSVKLIPRMEEWVNTNFPGTKLGLTDSWGAEEHISGGANYERRFYRIVVGW